MTTACSLHFMLQNMLGAVHSFYKKYVTGIFFWQLKSLIMKTCVWRGIYFAQLKGTSFCLNQCQQPAHKRQQYIKSVIDLASGS